MSQLNQHIKSGDSEVDGSEVERRGFGGHPMCEFCKSPFYGDNELYTHMTREHFSCHICQRYSARLQSLSYLVRQQHNADFVIVNRQHSGQYDYFRNYDDLEVCYIYIKLAYLYEIKYCLKFNPDMDTDPVNFYSTINITLEKNRMR